MKKTCFDCRYADIDPGSPDVWYLPNGDPGDPGDPPCAYCQDPLSDKLRDYYCEMLLTIEEFAIHLILSNDSVLPRNVMFKVHNKLLSQGMSGDEFAQFCPMFHQATNICKSCGIEFNGRESYCLKCESKSYEEDHLSKC